MTIPRGLLSILRLAVLAAVFLPPLHAGDDWTSFRGPGARGISTQKNLPDRWSQEENVAWKVDIPGRGWSSPIVLDDLVFITTAINTGDDDVEPRKGLYGDGNRSEPSPHEHQWVVQCLELGSGEVLWEQVAHEGHPAHPIHIKNTYASETPVTDGERLYVYFGNVGLFAYDLEGDLLWKRHWDPVSYQAGWGPAASPVVHGDRLYIINDNEEQSYLEALDKKTGETIWRVERDEKSNWSTPYVWETGERTELVTPGSGKVRSYDLDGSLLWELRGMSGITIATPYEAHGLLFVTSGFVLSRSKPIYAIRPGALGDISLGQPNAETAIAWSVPRDAPYNPSTIVVGDHLYSLLDSGILSCLDAKTGKKLYSRERVVAGSGVTASPWSYDGKIFCLDEDGVTHVVRAGETFEILHRNDLQEMCMATPAIAKDTLLIRTLSALYAIRASSDS